MNQDSTHPIHGGEDPRISDVVARFLAGRDTQQGLDEYLLNVPEDIRDDARRLIINALTVEQSLEEFWEGEDLRVEPEPEIEGFRVEAPIGSGGLGTVYSAWDETLQRRVAIKVLRRGTAADVRDRILDEARKAAALRDPAVVTIHSIAQGADTTAMVMELVEGYPFDRATGSLTFKQRARLLLAVVRALIEAHERGIIHRDLKPQNILVTPDLQPKILDFGLALRLDSEAAGGAFEGTPLYASPEQAAGEEAITPASDVFSFGSVMFTALTGKSAFDGASSSEVLAAVQSEDPPFPRTLNPGVPTDLQSICMACMSRAPERRPSAREVAADLERYLAGEPARLRPAMYGDILRDRLTSHQQELQDWAGQGIISEVERDQLGVVYRRMLADEEHWIFDARRLSLLQVSLYTGTWMVVVAAMLLTALAWDDLSPVMRSVYPSAFTLILGFMGLVAFCRRDRLASAAFFSGMVLACAPAILAVLAERSVLLPPENVKQALSPPFSNEQLLASFLGALAISLGALSFLRLTAFAWTTAFLVALSWLAFLMTHDWLDQDTPVQAFQLLPLVLLVVPALVFEARDRVRWSLPFYLLALVALIACLDAMTDDGWSLRRLGIPLELSSSRLQQLAIALNGLVFLLVMVVIERTRSLDLRRGARLLEVVVPVHLIGGLYAFAAKEGNWESVTLYGVAIVALLLIGPWRSRHRILTGGLVGIALASHLVIDIELVDAIPFCLGLAAAGLVCAVTAYLRLSPRK